MELSQTAARSARAFLDAHTRTDWSYPALPPPRTASDEEVSTAVAFRERYYGESESSDSEGEPANASASAAQGANGSANEYKFDSPDAIGAALSRSRSRRRARRRARLEDEMAVNEGLRIWVERRDAWTGAASVRRFGVKRRRGATEGATESVLKEGDATAAPAAADANTETRGADATPPDAADAPPSTESPGPPDTLPLAPPLLPTNPLRASITPKSYPDIYTKIVASSRTPAVPINLSDMTRALVQGWKDADEWPPRVGGVDPLAGRRRGAGGGLGGSLGGLMGGHGGHGGQGQGGFIHRHPHLEKGVGSVRKILHLSGSAHGANGSAGANGNGQAEG
ncbi:hypothetical protein C7974DRAFT_401323 [Boeremia exigua]|uniref:uncharacterized protein n=1 Tax=Boeremia exigua TaxID=749465 RepID=UPI001E8CC34C|nr:uncharacterized protein C7974DRAFT_401323 [Boeremia exigua]KAH6619011.1 hypothetical protein C7974DRAFT_401323 [Boeremia exigua]